MYGLRLKLTLIFLGSVLAVMLVATAVTAVLVGMGENERLAGPMARNIAMTTNFYLARETGMPPPPPKERFRLVEALPEGEPRTALTDALQSALAREGETHQVDVIETTEGRSVAALQLEDGRHLLFDMPPPPRGLPPSLFAALLAWLGLTLVGVTAVALLLARRVTEPFQLLEQAVASVGPDGVLPKVPEKGGAEVRRMGAALNTLSERVKSAMDSRMRLVAAAGHDLRTPMTRMRLRAEFVAEDERKAWLADLDELDAIADSAIRLVREEGAGEDRTPVALDDLVTDTARELSEAGLKVELGNVAPATVTGGPLALRRALRNLMTNAATHGGGGYVALSISDAEAELVIDDNGPGIPAELIPQVFEPFFRANPGRGQTIKGAGLGLAIAREIIERFGGSIEITNRSEGGLRQTVRMRLSDQPVG